MERCAYCGRPATLKIASNPDDVCFEHAVEFWTGLLAYVRSRSEVELTREAQDVSAAPSDHAEDADERIPTRLAS